MANYIISIIIFAMLFPIKTYSFEGLPEVPGNVVVPLNKTKIRLEKILITGDKHASVKSLFELVNESSADEAVLLGFPFKKKGDHHGEPEYFLVKVNGLRQPFSIIQTGHQAMPDRVEDYEMVYQWQMVLKSGEKVRIECSFDVNWYYDDPRDVGGSFTYLLSLIRLWTKPVKEAVIRIELPERYATMWKARKIELEVVPSESRIVNGIIEWNYTDWTPEDDIHIEVRKAPPMTYENGDGDINRITDSFQDVYGYEGNRRYYSIDDLERFGSEGESVRTYLRILRNEIFARNGRVFASEYLMKIFNNTKWYKPNPQYSDNQLNDIERRNVQFIVDYEKKKGWR